MLFYKSFLRVSHVSTSPCPIQLWVASSTNKVVASSFQLPMLDHRYLCLDAGSWTLSAIYTMQVIRKVIRSNLSHTHLLFLLSQNPHSSLLYFTAMTEFTVMHVLIITHCLQYCSRMRLVHGYKPIVYCVNRKVPLGDGWGNHIKTFHCCSHVVQFPDREEASLCYACIYLLAIIHLTEQCRYVYSLKLNPFPTNDVYMRHECPIFLP